MATSTFNLAKSIIGARYSPTQRCCIFSRPACCSCTCHRDPRRHGSYVGIHSPLSAGACEETGCYHFPERGQGLWALIRLGFVKALLSRLSPLVPAWPTHHPWNSSPAIFSSMNLLSSAIDTNVILAIYQRASASVLAQVLAALAPFSLLGC
jgi:hypothetical protein